MQIASARSDLQWPRMTRRSFLQSSTAITLGLQRIARGAEASRANSGLSDPGFHPISPERLIVLADQDQTDQKDRSAEFVDESKLSSEKYQLMSRLIRIMTDYYGVPQAFPRWMKALAKREKLASTGMGFGFGYFYEFQDVEPLQLDTPPVDWWLFLFPDGIDWQSGESVYGLFGHVFPPDHRNSAGFKVRTYGETFALGMRIGRAAMNWERIARLDQVTAAQVVNQEIAIVSSYF